MKALLEPSNVYSDEEWFSGLLFRLHGVYLLKSVLPNYLLAKVPNPSE